MNAFFQVKESFSFAMKFLFKLSLVLFILTCSVASFSGQFEIQVGSGWMKGKADGVPLGKVLTEVTQKAGYLIYIDEKLLKIPISFNIQNKLAPEKFIRRIVRPHSYAIVFGGEDKGKISTIHEIWVFPKGRQFTARYVDLKAASRGGDMAVSSGAMSGSVSPNAISDGGRSVDGKRLVKRSLHIKENAYGGPSFTYKDPKKGPDYRLTPLQRQQAYWTYRTEKKQFERRNAERMLSRTRREFEASRDEHWARRNSEIRQHIMDLKNSRDKEETK